MRRIRRRRALIGFPLVAGAAAALAGVALAAPGDVVLVSQATGPAGPLAGTFAQDPSISASGGRVAFASDADNLSPEDDDAVTNVYVRDVATGATLLVSRASGVAGAAADGRSQNPAVSGSGRFVAFESDADNLSPDDNNGASNVFVRDLVTHTTTLVSRRSGVSGGAANGSSSRPDISAGGRFVAFQSRALNLSGAAGNVTNVFVRDLVRHRTTLISRASGAGGPGALDASSGPAISGDGNRVAFQSGADNLSSEDDNSVTNVYVRDRAARTTTLVSRRRTGVIPPANGGSGDVDISPSGRFVAFASHANNLSPDDDNGVENVFVRDLRRGVTVLASRASGLRGVGADDRSGGAVVSDRARVAFHSLADNLSAGDNDAQNVFVRDVLAGTTALASRASGPFGPGGDGKSSEPSVSRDGRYVAFTSSSGNLVPGGPRPVLAAPSGLNVYRRDLK
jgi:Tol biopolymer transport system component